jgi:sugar phosphate isomerase/epimerase
MITSKALLAAGLTILILLAPGLASAEAPVFGKQNLVAWCIVPFDAVGRGPVQRARMLKSLGIEKFAYDWREKDIPTFDQELDALREQGIELTAFWFPTGMDPANEKNPRIIVDFLARRKVNTQLWLSVDVPKEFAALSQEEKVRATAKPVAWVAAEAKKIGCTVALYNHGGWFGEPENQIAIIREVKAGNLGIVYNFHHGHQHIARFPELFAKMLPYLYAVNLNGMRDGGEPKILDIGKGEREREMILVVKKSSYRGPIGILNHREELDAEVGLRGNIEGLKNLLRELGDEEALRTY